MSVKEKGSHRLLTATSLLCTLICSSSAITAVQISPEMQKSLTAPVSCHFVPGAVDPKGSITIKGGGTYCFRVAVAEDRVSITQVTKTEAQEQLLTMRLMKERGKEDHFLYITNGTPFSLKYHASIRTSLGTALSPTSSCPVPSKAAALEHWSYSVIELRINSVEVLQSLDNVACD